MSTVDRYVATHGQPPASSGDCLLVGVVCCAGVREAVRVAERMRSLGFARVAIRPPAAPRDRANESWRVEVRLRSEPRDPGALARRMAEIERVGCEHSARAAVDWTARSHEPRSTVTAAAGRPPALGQRERVVASLRAAHDTL